MKLIKLAKLIFLFSLLTKQVIDCSEDDYDSEYEDISDINIPLNESLSLNSTEDDYNEYDYEEEEEEECTVDAMFDHYSQLILPDDYEEGKKLDFEKKDFSLAEIISRIKRLKQYQQNITQKLDPIMKKVMPRLFELLFFVDLPSDCMTTLARIGQSAKEGQKWARKFITTQPAISLADSVISPPLGDYDECLAIESTEPELSDKPKIYGHYCSITLPTNFLPKADPSHVEDFAKLDKYYGKKIKENISGKFGNSTKEMSSLRSFLEESDGTLLLEMIQYLEHLGAEQQRQPTGLCLPSTCNPKDIEWAINKIMFPLIKFNIIIDSDCDYKGKPIVLDKYHIITITSFAVLLVIVTTSTVIYLLKKSCLPESKEGQTLISRVSDCFSIIPNFRAIFDSKSKSNMFSAMDGIKAILCYWVFLQHEYETGMIPLWSKKMRRAAPTRFKYELKYILFINWNLLDTFFLIGGMLNCYVVITRMDKSKGRFNYIQYALHRYFRMMPIILAAMGISIILELMGDGPYWPLMTLFFKKPCIDNPWQTITMTNNYVTWPDLLPCVPVAWYTASDMQFYLLAPIIILVLYYWPKVGIVWSIILIILGSFIALAPKILYGIPHLFNILSYPNFRLWAKVLSHNYWGLEQHVQIYVLGIFLGFLIKRHPKIYLGGRIGEVPIWIVSWGLTTYAIFWHRDFYKTQEYPMTDTQLNNWLAFSKLCYCAGWCWLFYACITGRAGFINRFFSWNGFKPISYLMLEIYILHIFIIAYRTGSTREKIFFSDYYVWTVMVLDFILTFILSIIINLLVTKPFANLLNLFLMKNTEKESHFNNNNKINGDQKLSSEETKDGDIIDLKVVTFGNTEVMTATNKSVLLGLPLKLSDESSEFTRDLRTLD